MKRDFKILSVLIAILIVPLCYAEKEKVINTKTDKIEQKSQEDISWIIGDDDQKSQSWSEDSWQNKENIDQKSNSWELTEEEKKESEKISKWLNNLLIETYKSKYSVILNNLSNNIKDKKKEDKIKILSSLIIAIKPRIELINSWKVNLTENRKEVLLALLNYIIQDTEKRIQNLVKEK